MKPRKLYIKILLAFLGVLFVTEILILALFISTAGRSFKNHFDEQSLAKLFIFRETVQEKINNEPGLPLEQNSGFKEFLITFSQLFDLKIWVTQSDDSIVFKTFSSRIDLSPIDISKDRHSWGRHSRQTVVRDNIRLYHLSRRHLSYYAVIAIKNMDNPYTLHLYLDNKRVKKPEAIFFIGLLTIGGVIALLVIPLTRLITKRIAQLNESALEFANGNLKCRTNIKGKDEIAKLGKSFNFMADKLEKMIQGNKEMMANLSHELRSPLARIRISKELIRERVESASTTDIDRYADHIDQDIDTLDTLIDQILKLSKMDFQEESDSKEHILLAPFFKEIEKKFGPALSHKNLILKKRFEPQIGLYTDPGCLDTIFSNLLDNAVKYTPEHGHITVTAKNKDADSILFSIANPHPKLSDKELDRLFKPYFRGDSSQAQGSGLGLTIIEKLMKKCNANIVAKSDNKGLAFELEFKIE